MARIFISYRRDDSAGWAGRLATDLEERFGSESVFQDIEKIEPGEDFIVAIENSLGSCSAVLIVIGPEWTSVKDKHGVRRLDNQDDPVRLEAAKALEQKDKAVIPVLVGGAAMPAADDLPPNLKALSRRNAIELTDKRWDYDLNLLAAELAKKTGLSQHRPERFSGAGLKHYWIISVCAVAILGILLGYYLIKPPKAKKPITKFSIDQPVSGAELPIDASQNWILEGTLQLARESTPKITIEVFRLPAREAIPQRGVTRYSTERSVWRYESATFAGEGLYEILATISLEGRSDWRSLQVKCVPKASAYLQAINREGRFRRIAPINSLRVQSLDLEALKKRVLKLQDEFFQFYPNDLDKAEDNAAKTLDILRPALPAYPDDFDLQNLRAYALKNYAMVMRDRGRTEEFNQALNEAEKMFEAIRQQRPDDPSAWNGLGNMAILRNDGSKALYYIDRALEIAPGYEAARSDRAIALKMLNAKPIRR